MREPAFWYRRPSLNSRLLRPLGALYGAVAARRLQRPASMPAFPCCASAIITAAAPARRRRYWRWPDCCANSARRRSCSAAAMAADCAGRCSRSGAPQRRRRRRRAADAGAHVAVAVARDRVAGVALARSKAATVILMDDGFQNPAIVKDASLIVIDSDRAIGNACMFPAGPLRAPLRRSSRAPMR